MLRRTSRALLGLTIALAVLAPITLASPAHARAVDRDCGDFSTQAAAQKFFLNHGGPGSDPHDLDADGDGIACESNPCPCNYSKGGDDKNDEPKAPKNEWVRVVKVISGDTLQVRFSGGGKAKVRLIGVNSPDLRPMRCGAVLAKKSAKQLLPRGARVKLLTDKALANKDPQGRLNRYVVKGGRDVNYRQVYRGWGKALDRKYKRSAGYHRAERSAQRNDRGIWGMC